MCSWLEERVCSNCGRWVEVLYMAVVVHWLDYLVVIQRIA